VIPEFQLDKTVFEDPENPQPEECLQVVDQFFAAIEWEEDTEAQNIVDDFFSQVEASAENPVESLVAVGASEQAENLVEADDSDPLAMIAEMKNLIAVDEPEQAENLVAADESDPLAMIAEMENLIAVDEPEQLENLISVDDTEFSYDEMDAEQIVDTFFNCAESEFSIDEDLQDNPVAADEGQNGSIENSDLDDVYQAFSNQVNSK